MTSISIVIATRNRESYVKDLICDLLAQSLLPHEIILIDQSDLNLKVAYSNCIYIHDEGIGPCRARNLGASHASSDILVFLDDDIRIAPDFLINLCDPILHQGYQVSTGAILDAEGKYKKTSPNFWRNNSNHWIAAMTADPGHPGIGITLSFAAGCSAIKRELFHELGGFDSFFDPNGAGEDREFALRLFHSGYPIYYNGQAKVIHLAANIGGRRNNQKYYYELSPLDANLVYIVAKYFGWPVFNKYCNDLSRSLFYGSISLNPVTWFRSFRKVVKARQWMKMIKEIKLDQGWN
jgi:GT2 family glycosyltransferase